MQVMATATQMQNNFGRYLNHIIQGDEVIVTKNGKEVGRLVPRKEVLSLLTDSLVGIAEIDSKSVDDLQDERERLMLEKYESID